MSNFIKKLTEFSLGPIISALIGFITVPVTTYFISPEEFGKASMFALVQSIVVTFVYLGIDQAYTREYHYEKNKKKLFQNALILPVALSILFGLIITIYNKQFSTLLFDSPIYKYVSPLFAIMVVSSVIERFILLSLRMEEKALEYSFFTIFLKLSVLMMTIIFLLFGDRSFLAIVNSTIVGQLFSDAILFLRYRELFKFKISYIDKELFKRMFKFGLPLIVAASVSNLLTTSGRLFLRLYSTFHDLGIYNAALKIAGVLQIIQNAFTSFWVPVAYRWNKEKRSMEHFSFISDALLAVLTVIFFCILILKEFLIGILASGYSEAQYIVGLLALTPILYTLSETSTLGIVFSGKSYLNLWVSFLSIIPNIVLNYLLVPRIGTVGAAIATAISYVVFCIARTYFSNIAGFKINFSKQFFNIFIFLLAGIINTSSGEWIMPITLVLFMISVTSQLSLIKDIKDIGGNPLKWDFS